MAFLFVGAIVCVQMIPTGPGAFLKHSCFALLSLTVLDRRGATVIPKVGRCFVGSLRFILADYTAYHYCLFSPTIPTGTGAI